MVADEKNLFHFYQAQPLPFDLLLLWLVIGIHIKIEKKREIKYLFIFGKKE
jgi:hypothetical protein